MISLLISEIKPAKSALDKSPRGQLRQRSEIVDRPPFELIPLNLVSFVTGKFRVYLFRILKEISLHWKEYLL